MTLNHAELLRTAAEDHTIDIIYDAVNDALMRGAFPVVNLLLQVCDPTVMASFFPVSLLVITASAKSKLPARAAFFYKTRDELESRGELVDKLLRGLE